MPQDPRRKKPEAGGEASVDLREAGLNPRKPGAPPVHSNVARIGTSGIEAKVAAGVSGLATASNPSDYEIARDPRQEQAGYPYPPASHEEAMEEQRMGANPDIWKRRYVDRKPDINKPVPLRKSSRWYEELMKRGAR